MPVHQCHLMQRCLGALKVYARNNQATIITPFIVAGAMAPTTAVGVAAQSLAEGLAGMAFAQLVRPGTPVIYGNFVTAMSMKSGAPTFGTPEAAHMMNISGALARRLAFHLEVAVGLMVQRCLMLKQAMRLLIQCKQL